MIAHTSPVVKPTRLAQQAITALTNACVAEPADRAFLVEERNVWQPGSWLLQRCWETLADSGAGDEALFVAALMQTRHPLAPLQALHRVAQRAGNGMGNQDTGYGIRPNPISLIPNPVKQRPLLAMLVRAELERQETALFRPTTSGDETRLRERLLLAAATAGLVEHLSLACACLERLDQLEKTWEGVFAHSESRLLLAESIAHVGLHPLTMALIDNAIRRFDDAGAQFLHEIVALIARQGETAPRRSQHLLRRCVETFRYATLSTLQSRRLAAITLGRAGLVDEVLSQLAFIANVQDARRETGLSAYKDDSLLLRQVKRPSANGDIDFQVYTLQQTVNAMPIRQIPREKRIALADQLAFLGVRSDGWTAAGAAVTLIELGALQYAVEVVEHVAPNDPTRPSSMLELVRGLLAVEEPGMAAEQAQRALAWARARADRNPERAVTWGLAEIYLDQGESEKALRWLAQWRKPAGLRGALWARLASLWRKQMDDDRLRLHSLRLRALLQRNGVAGDAAALRAYTKEVQSLVSELHRWAPRLLEGEALVNFLVDGLLRPLLAAARRAAGYPLGGHRPWARNQAWAVLAELSKALSTTSGNKHVMHVAAVTTLLAQQLHLAAAPDGRQQMADGAPATSHQREPSGRATSGSPLGAPPPDAELRQVAETFLSQIWDADAKRGPWQIIHSIEGSIPLLLTLEGPQSLVAIARAASEIGCLWE